MESGADYIDVELKAVEEFNNSMRGKKPAKCKLIVYSHNYQCTPSIEDLGNLVAAIQASGADIVKIATTAVDITDAARVFQISVHSQVSGCQHLEHSIAGAFRVLCSSASACLNPDATPPS